MESAEPVVEAKVKAASSVVDIVAKNPFGVGIVLLIGAIVICAFIILLVFIYIKFMRKKKDVSPKKKQKCDHKKDRDKQDDETTDEKVNKLDDILSDIKAETRKQTEYEEREKIANAEINTSDVKKVDEETSYEDDST